MSMLSLLTVGRCSDVHRQGHLDAMLVLGRKDSLVRTQVKCVLSIRGL